MQAVGFEPRRLRELQSMVPEVVDRTGGSKWVQARLTEATVSPLNPQGSLRIRRNQPL